MRAGGDATASAIELVGDRPLSFTTLKLRGPPRVVVDFAETDLALQVRDLAVDDGTIRRVAAAPAGQKTARVVIELTGEAEFSVRANGSTLEVRVPRIAPLVATAEPPGRDAAEPGAAAKPAEQQATAQDRVAPPPAAEPDSPVAGGRAAPAADAGSQERASPPTVERAGARAQPAADESRGAEERREKIAAAAPPAAQKAAAAETKPARRAAGEHPHAGRTAAPIAPRHSITGIGFRPVGGGEVIVRSDHPLAYGVSVDGAAVVLHLPGAGIPLLNNRRPLDTHFFDGPVQRVVPLAVADGTDLRIELNGRADYQLAQSGGVLTVTFSAPR